MKGNREEITLHSESCLQVIQPTTPHDFLTHAKHIFNQLPFHDHQEFTTALNDFQETESGVLSLRRTLKIHAGPVRDIVDCVAMLSFFEHNTNQQPHDGTHHCEQVGCKVSDRGVFSASFVKQMGRDKNKRVSRVCVGFAFLHRKVGADEYTVRVMKFREFKGWFSNNNQNKEDLKKHTDGVVKMKEMPVVGRIQLMTPVPKKEKEAPTTTEKKKKNQAKKRTIEEVVEPAEATLDEPSKMIKYDDAYSMTMMYTLLLYTQMGNVCPGSLPLQNPDFDFLGQLPADYNEKPAVEVLNQSKVAEDLFDDQKTTQHVVIEKDLLVYEEDLTSPLLPLSMDQNCWNVKQDKEESQEDSLFGEQFWKQSYP